MAASTTAWTAAGAPDGAVAVPSGFIRVVPVGGLAWTAADDLAQCLLDVNGHDAVGGHPSRALERDHVVFRARAEVAVDRRREAGVGEVSLQYAHVVAVHSLAQDAVSEVPGVTAAAAAAAADRGCQPPAAAAATAGVREDRRREREHRHRDSDSRATRCADEDDVGHLETPSLSAPAGLAVGLALKEIALRRELPAIRPRGHTAPLGPPLPNAVTPGIRLGCCRRGHSSERPRWMSLRSTL